MPRSKTRKPRKAASLSASDTQRRTSGRKVAVDDLKPQAGLNRRKRMDLRPPKFPGRLGGR